MELSPTAIDLSPPALTKASADTGFNPNNNPILIIAVKAKTDLTISDFTSSEHLHHFFLLI